MPVTPGLAADKNQKPTCASSRTKKTPEACSGDQGKQRAQSQQTLQDSSAHLDLSLSSTIKEDISFTKRAVLVAVNLTIMLISVIVLWHALYSYAFRPSQPYTFWGSLFTKSFAFTLLLHLDVFLIIISGFLAIGSGVGLVGALRENVSLLQAYVVFIVLFVVVLITLAVLAFAYPEAARRSVMEKSSYVHFVRAYRNNPDFQHLVDSVQESLQCCGFSEDSFRDWDHNEYYRCNMSNPSVERCNVPPSCCRPTNSSKEAARNRGTMCAKGVLLMDDPSAWKVVYTRSCADATHAYFASNSGVYGTAALLVATICLVLTVLTQDVQDEIVDLGLIYQKYYQTVAHGQAAMHKAGVIKVLKPDNAKLASTVSGSRPVVSSG
ncbi:tetraspanin-33-like [Dermacentor albipictus]|uniref:tetraspanin-33-like n=1 Tax=Dermacentor albipictus TaxID=60249 RepID=UPI0031FE32BB